MPSTHRQRLSADETKERLLDAGLASLARSGMSVGLDSVNLEHAVRDADVSRSSAYLVWSTDEQFSPQEMFQRAVLRRAVEDRNTTIERLQASAYAVVEEHGEAMAPLELLRELIRFAGTENVQAVADSSSWQLVIALRAILHSAPDGERDEELADWMNDSEETLRNATIDRIYRPLVELVGLIPRPEYGELAYQYGEISAAAMSEGLAMRYSLRAREHLDGLIHPVTKDPENTWSLHSLMFEKIVQTFFIPSDGSDW
jgi:AcrR family transcriptional regulator